MARENLLQVIEALNPLVLSTGRQCRLSRPCIPGLQNYYVLSMPAQASNMDEEDEFHVLAHRVARSVAQVHFGDTQCYSLMYSAGRTRRRPWPHAHLIIANSVQDRRRSVLVLQLKHLLWWRRWLPFVRSPAGRSSPATQTQPPTI